MSYIPFKYNYCIRDGKETMQALSSVVKGENCAFTYQITINKMFISLYLVGNPYIRRGFRAQLWNFTDLMNEVLARQTLKKKLQLLFA